jgi:hypothetical protein
MHSALAAISNSHLLSSRSRNERCAISSGKRSRSCAQPYALELSAKRQVSVQGKKDIPRITSCVAQNPSPETEALGAELGRLDGSSSIRSPLWGYFGYFGVDFGETTDPHFFGRAWRHTTTPCPREEPSYLGSMEGGIHPSPTPGPKASATNDTCQFVGLRPVALSCRWLFPLIAFCALRVCVHYLPYEEWGCCSRLPPLRPCRKFAR